MLTMNVNYNSSDIKLTYDMYVTVEKQLVVYMMITVFIMRQSLSSIVFTITIHLLDLYAD